MNNIIAPTTDTPTRLDFSGPEFTDADRELIASLSPSEIAKVSAAARDAARAVLRELGRPPVILHYWPTTDLDAAILTGSAVVSFCGQTRSGGFSLPGGPRTRGRRYVVCPACEAINASRV